MGEISNSTEVGGIRRNLAIHVGYNFPWLHNLFASPDIAPQSPFNSVSGSAPHKPWARWPSMGQSFSTVFQGTTPAHPFLRLQWNTSMHAWDHLCRRVSVWWLHKDPSPLEPRDCGSELGLGPKLWRVVNRQPYEYQPRFQGPVHRAAIAGPSRPASMRARKSLLRLHARAAVILYPPCRSTSWLNMGKRSARNHKAYFVSGVEMHKRCHALLEQR